MTFASLASLKRRRMRNENLLLETVTVLKTTTNRDSSLPLTCLEVFYLNAARLLHFVINHDISIL